MPTFRGSNYVFGSFGDLSDDVYGYGGFGDGFDNSLFGFSSSSMSLYNLSFGGVPINWTTYTELTPEQAAASADGDDFLFGGLGSDVLFGGTGNDTLFGGAAGFLDVDVLFGGYGDDVLLAGNAAQTSDGGRDELYGGPGSDLLYAGDYSNLINGGAGLDIILYNKPRAAYEIDLSDPSRVVITDLSTGTYDILSATEFAIFNVAVGSIGRGQFATYNSLIANYLELEERTGLEDVAFIGALFDDNDNDVDFNILSDDQAQSIEFIRELSGSVGDYIYNAYGGNDTVVLPSISAAAATGFLTTAERPFDGGDGNDTITGSDADDFLRGGLGDDVFKLVTIERQGPNDNPLLYAGRDTVSGGEGIDAIELPGDEDLYDIVYQGDGAYLITTVDLPTVTNPPSLPELPRGTTIVASTNQIQEIERLVFKDLNGLVKPFQPKWGDGELGTSGGVVQVALYLGDLPYSSSELADIREIVLHSFSAWQRVANIRFEIRELDSFDFSAFEIQARGISLSFDDSEFVGTYNDARAVNGRAWTTTDDQAITSSRIRISPERALDGALLVQGTIIHEIGHAIGLHHTDPSIARSILTPNSSPRDAAGVFSIQAFDASYAAYVYGSAQTVLPAKYYLPDGVQNYLIPNDPDPAYIVGNDLDNVIQTGSGNDILVAGSGRGNDSYDGGGGVDTIVYSSTSFGIDIDLEVGSGGGPEVDSDIISNIENVVGGGGADVIDGDGRSNVIEGGAGNDSLDGRSGIDTARYQGLSTDYLITEIGDGGFIVSDLVGTGLDEGTDIIRNIERIQFLGDNVTVTLIADTDPVAVPDAFGLQENALLQLANVLANDFDLDGDTLSVAAVNGVAANVSTQIALASGALLTVSGGGQVNYNPNGAFNALNTGETATDSFTYTVSDGNGGTSTATATVTINGVGTAPVNQPPVAQGDGSATAEDAVIASLNLLTNDSDPDGDMLTVSAVNGVAANVGSQITLASGALLTVGANGVAAYNPNGAFNALNSGETATDSFTYTISDGNGGTSTATATITINGSGSPTTGTPALDLVQPLSQAGSGVSIVSATYVGAAEAIAGFDGVNFGTAAGTELVLGPGVLMTSGRAEQHASNMMPGFSNSNSGGRYEPLEQVLGGLFPSSVTEDAAILTIRFTVSDPTATSISVDAIFGSEEFPEYINNFIDVAGVFVDGVNYAYFDLEDPTTPLSVTQSNVSAGYFFNNAPATSTAAGIAGTPLATEYDGVSRVLRISGALDPSLTEHTIIIAIADTSDSALDSGIFISNLRVGDGGVGINVAPAAQADSLSTLENAALPAFNLLSNDTDADGDALTVAAVNGVAASVGAQVTLASGALLTVGANGLAAYDPNGVFNALNTGETATDTFTYTVSDGRGGTSTATATVTVNGVSPVNQPPVAQDDAATVSEDFVITGFNLLANDTEPDGDGLVVTAVNGEAAAVGLQITLASGALLTVGANGIAAYNPNGVFNALNDGETATDSFSYTVSDGRGGTSTANATVTISGEGEVIVTPPVAVDDALTVTESEDGGDLDGNVRDNDTNPAGAPLAVASVAGVAANVGTTVAGSNGGLFTINADGTFDFDANGEFESLNDGETSTTSISYGITYTGAANVVDVVLLQDLSGSFVEDLANIRGQFGGLYDTLNGSRDVQFGVASYVDKAVYPFGSPGDYVYQTHLAVSGDKTSIQAALDSLQIRSGGDVPEAQFEALLQLAVQSSGEVGFREGAQRIVVLSTDAIPHLAGDYPTGSAGPNDADGVLEDEDYPSVPQLREALEAANITPVFLVTSDVIAQYQSLVEQLGRGSVVELTSTSSNLAAAVVGALNGVTTTDSATLTVTVAGETDAASNTPPVAKPDQYSVSEDSKIKAGLLLKNDFDKDGDAITIVAVNGRPANVGVPIVLASGAMLTVSAAGAFAYDPGDAFDYLKACETATDSFTYTISDGNGGTSTGTATISVQGDDDKAVIAGQKTGSVSEDGISSASGLLTVSDPDAGEAQFKAGVLTSKFGTLNVAEDGSWSYLLDNSSSKVQGLNALDKVADKFTVYSADGTNITISIEISGVDDVPPPKSIVGSSKGEKLNGTSGADHINPLGGNDVVHAKGGDDWIKGTINDGNDRIDGAAGNDTVDYSSLTEGVSLYLGSKHASAKGSVGGAQSGADSLVSIENAIGTQGNDTIAGNKYANVIEGGAGHDKLSGGAGADTFVFKQNFGHDVVTDFAAAGKHHDVVQFSDGVVSGWSVLEAMLSDSAAGALLSLDDSNSITFTGVTKSQLVANHVDDFRFS